MYKVLFEQMDLDVSRDMLVDLVQKDIDYFLNGVLVNDVKVQLSENQTNNGTNKIFISITFTYRQSQSNVNLEVNTLNV